VWRSIDQGQNWTDLGAVVGVVYGGAYLGFGIVILTTTNGHIWRSTDYAQTWTDLGAVAGAGSVASAVYCENGVALVTDTTHVYRSASAFGEDNYFVQPTPTKGSYVGDNTNNRAIPHRLGRIPGYIFVNDRSFSSGGRIGFISGATQTTYSFSTVAVTAADSTNFYVSHNGGAPPDFNLTGTTYDWAVF
jgi:hypothetical protein